MNAEQMITDVKEFIDTQLKMGINHSYHMENDVKINIISSKGYAVISVMHRHDPTIVVYPSKDRHMTIENTMDISNIHGAIVAHQQVAEVATA